MMTTMVNEGHGEQLKEVYSQLLVAGQERIVVVAGDGVELVIQQAQLTLLSPLMRSCLASLPPSIAPPTLFLPDIASRALLGLRQVITTRQLSLPSTSQTEEVCETAKLLGINIGLELERPAVATGRISDPQSSIEANVQYSCKLCEYQVSQRHSVLLHILKEHKKDNFSHIPHLAENEIHCCYYTDCDYATRGKENRDRLLAHLVIKHDEIDILDLADNYICDGRDDFVEAAELEKREAAEQEDGEREKREAAEREKREAAESEDGEREDSEREKREAGEREAACHRH